MPAIAILLPPSEGKASGGTGPNWRSNSGVFGKELSRRRESVIEALRAVDGGDGKLLGVAGANLATARAANLALTGSTTLPAWSRYTGVVWDHLGPSTMSTAVRRRAGASVLVVSGLLGLVAFDDPVPDYKLKIGATLPGLGKLATWWREPLSTVMNERLTGCWVVDLLPNEHRAAWNPSPGDYAGAVSVTFVEKSGQVAGHDAKAAKGSLARHLLESKSAPDVALRAWKHPRFRLEIREVSHGRS
ncbi:MAG: YaaA family protein [Acidimicrobiia bacterium]